MFNLGGRNSDTELIEQEITVSTCISSLKCKNHNTNNIHVRLGICGQRRCVLQGIHIIAMYIQAKKLSTPHKMCTSLLCLICNFKAVIEGRGKHHHSCIL